MTRCPLVGCPHPARGHFSAIENGERREDYEPLCVPHARLIAARAQVTLCKVDSNAIRPARRLADRLWLEAYNSGLPVPERSVAPMYDPPQSTRTDHELPRRIQP